MLRLKDTSIYKKVLDNNLARRAVEIERINVVVINENNKLRAEILLLQEQVFQLTEELEHDLTPDDFMGHFVGEYVTTDRPVLLINEKTLLTNNNNKNCCIIL